MTLITHGQKAFYIKTMQLYDTLLNRLFHYSAVLMVYQEEISDAYCQRQITIFLVQVNNIVLVEMDGKDHAPDGTNLF